MHSIHWSSYFLTVSPLQAHPFMFCSVQNCSFLPVEREKDKQSDFFLVLQLLSALLLNNRGLIPASSIFRHAREEPQCIPLEVPSRARCGSLAGRQLPCHVHSFSGLPAWAHQSPVRDLSTSYSKLTPRGSSTTSPQGPSAELLPFPFSSPSPRDGNCFLQVLTRDYLSIPFLFFYSPNM